MGMMIVRRRSEIKKNAAAKIAQTPISNSPVVDAKPVKRAGKKK